MWLRRTALLLTLLAACEQEDEACASEDAHYHANVHVSMAENIKAAETAQPPVSGMLHASVYENSSVVRCGNGLVSESTPGQALVSNQPVYLDAAGFALNVDAKVYPQLVTSDLWLEVILDENGNGRCDDGEPQGGSAFPRAESSSLQVELKRAPCTLRL